MPITRQLKEKVAEYGVRFLHNQELLESLLEISQDRAADILDQSESLSRLAASPPDEIRRQFGLTERQGRLIATAAELGARLQQPPDVQSQIGCPQDAANLLAPRMSKLVQEELHVLLLNTRNRVIAERTVYVGTVNSSAVRPAEVVRPAVMLNAPSMILVHNHPSGDPTPSPEDVRVTGDIIAAGKLMDIAVLDHVVVGQGPWFVSMKERRLAFE